MDRSRLIEARKRKGWSQATAAYRLQISLSHYEKIERGVRMPGVHLARAINEVFGAHVCDAEPLGCAVDEVVAAAEASARASESQSA